LAKFSKTRFVLLVVALGLLSACGPNNPEVRVLLTSDDTFPCLGAKHIKFYVDLPDEDGSYVFDEFATPAFFDLDNYQCKFGEFTYDRLALSSAARIDVSLWDSTTGEREEHILARGSTVTFGVNDDSPNMEYLVGLSRRPEVSLGTAYLDMPTDWNTIKQGIYHLNYHVYKEDDQGTFIETVRQHQLAYERTTFPEPWPIIISNLPAPQSPEKYKVRIDGLDANNNQQRFWIGDIYLQTHTIAWVTWAVRY
jgi:hypothetical protein